MGIQNKLLKIEREAQEIVRLSELGAQTLVKLDLNYTDLIIRDNKGVEQARYKNASRDDRRKANDEASFLDEEANPEGAPHTIEAKSAITFNEDGTLDFGDAAFGVSFPTAEINKMIYDIEFYTDCENIKQMIDDQIQVLIDQIESKAPELANLAEINGLMSLPSDPLKILSWARKVVSKFFGPYTLAMIDLAMQLALFAGALARLAGAIIVAEQNLKLCAESIKEDLVDEVLEKINKELAGTIEKIDNVVDKIDEAQTKIGQITGKQPNFLPSSLQGGVSGLVQNLTNEGREKILRAGHSAADVPVGARTREQKEDIARLARLKIQDEKDRTELLSNVDGHLQTTIPGLDMAAAKASKTGKIQTPSSVTAFNADITEVVNRSFEDDPKAADDLAAAADTMNAALGLPPLGNAVPGTVQVTIDDATFTFQNGIMVQATGTNSGTGTGISTASVKSLPSTHSFIGTEWDGTIPGHVELITRLDGYGSPTIGSLPHGDIGPFGNPPAANEYTKKWPIPNNLKIVSAKFNLRNDRAGFGSGAFQFTSGSASQSQWRNAGTINTAFIYWFSATPGGAPMTDVNGNPVVRGGDIATDIRFVQGYDASLVSGGGMIGIEGTFGTRDVLESTWQTGTTIVPIDERVGGQSYNKLGEEPTASYEPLYADTGQGAHIMFPIITKTYFFNTALVEANAGVTYVATGTVPGASDLVQYTPSESKTGTNYQAHIENVANQCRVMRASISGDVDLPLTSPPLSQLDENRTEVVFEGSTVSGYPNARPYRLGAGGFLEETNFRTDSANNLYIAVNDNMESFVGAVWDGVYANTTQLITNWKYTDDTDVLSAASRANTDIGFASETPLTTPSQSPYKPRKYPIPTNGKISTSEFSFGWASYRTGLTFKKSTGSGRDAQLAGSEANFDRQYNSKFDMQWQLPADNLSHVWYDLDLMPVAWMSDVPGGSPRTLVDGTTGLVVKLDKAGGLYKAQQLSSATGGRPSFTGSFASFFSAPVIDAEAATFAIVQKKYFLNVAVVSANTATTIVAAGTAPTANQLISWSVSDAALGYIGNNDQHLTFEMVQRTFSNDGTVDPEPGMRQKYYNLIPLLEVAPGALPGTSPPDSVWPKGYVYTPLANTAI